MITVHHLNNSRSQRILWLLEELGVPYEIKHYQRNPKTMLAPPELKKVHPLGKSPVITDGHTTVAESGAIIEYLLDRYGQGRLRPAPTTPEYLRYGFYLHYAEGSLMPPLLMSLIFAKISQPPVPFFVRPFGAMIAAGVTKMFIGPNLRAAYDFMEKELAAHAWFAGSEFTAADIQMSFPLEAAGARDRLNEYPQLHAFLERIHARPAYQRALKAGGPYSLSM